jgi:hypothetical protein
MFPWSFQQPPKPKTPREVMLQRLSEGVPSDLASRAAGIDWEAVRDEPEVIMALAEGEIALFERARDSGVTGTVRAAMRYETKTWTPKAEPNSGQSLEDYLRD